MNDIHHIKPVINLNLFTSNQILLILIFFAFVLLFIVFLVNYFLWKKYFKKNKKDIQEIIVVNIDYAKQAQQKILKIKNKIELSKYREFCFEITQIIKEYLAGEYCFNCQDMTSEEILNYNKIDENIKKFLKVFFNKLDLVKFADHKVEKKQIMEIYNLALKIIK